MTLIHLILGIVGILFGIQLFRELIEDHPYVWTLLKTKRIGSSPKSISRIYTVIIFLMFLIFILGMAMFVTSPLPV